MTDKHQENESGGSRQQWRERFRGAFSGKRGRTIGIASIAAPIAGLIANDLRKADGIIRGVIAPTIVRLLPEKLGGRKRLDISDKADVIDHDK
jgi:hypothetical protein